MPKLKHIYVPAVIGFVLSFLISLIATHHFFPALLRALICAVAFAVLGAIISIVFENFLSEGHKTDSSLEDSQTKAPLGSSVDITISDEELTPDEAGPAFAVTSEADAPLSGIRDGSKLSGSMPLSSASGGTSLSGGTDMSGSTSMSGGTDVSGSVSGATVPSGASGSPSYAAAEDASSSPSGGEPAFRPVNLAGEPVQVNSAGGEAKASGEVSDIEQLDELPEIADLNIADSETLVEDSDFAEEGARPVSSRASYADGSAPDVKDAETMAKAIRTLLKKDE